METVSQIACASGEKNRGEKRRRSKTRYLKVTKKVLKSDEALWALYEKWCCQCKPYRTAEDKQMRFPFFKKTAFRVHEVNKKSGSESSGLTCLADLSQEERARLSGCVFRPKRKPVNAIKEDKDQEA